MPLKIKMTLLGFLILVGLSVQAGDITQVKNGKALLNLDAGEGQVGSEFFAVDSAGKKKAILRIKQVKGNKAIADVLKGTAESGMTLKARAAGGATSSGGTGAATGGDDHAARPKGFMSGMLKHGTAAGFMAGMAQNTMSLTAKGSGISEDISLAGNSFNIVGMYDYDLTSLFTLDIKAGLETFTTKGTAKNAVVCNNSTSCEVGFNYLSAEGNIHVNVVNGKTRVWVSGGLAFLVAMSKNSTVSNLDTSNSTNQMLLLGLGADIGLSKGSFVPVSFEYGLFPGSTSVKATSMILRAGYGWRY